MRPTLPIADISVTTLAFGLLVLLALIALVLAAVEALQRREAARASSDQQREWRADFMRALVKLVGRDTSKTRRLSRLRRRLGWNHGRFGLVRDYLRDNGLIQLTVSGEGNDDAFVRAVGVLGGKRLRVTSTGLDELDRAAHGATQHLVMGDQVIGDQYHVYGPAGAVGPRSEAHHVSFVQTWNDLGRPDTLGEELAQVRDHLASQDGDVARDVALAVLARAVLEARRGDGPASLRELSELKDSPPASRWAFDTATTIGTTVAAAALSKVLGL